MLDCWRRQAGTDDGVEAFLDLCKQWKPIGWAAEKGQLANAIEPFLRQRQRERNVPAAMEMFPTKGDKSVRCQSIRGRLALSGMLVPMQAEWWPEYVQRHADGLVRAIRPSPQTLRQPHRMKPKLPPNLPKPTKQATARARQQLARSLAMRRIGRKQKRR